MCNGEGVRQVVANLESGCAVSEERVNPVADVGWEALIMDDLSQAFWIKVIIKA